MKMGGSLFWGILLMLIGITIIIKVVFDINIPIGKFIIAFFLIYVGIKLLVGNNNFIGNWSDGETTIFGESKNYASAEEEKEYRVIFGGTVIDLRDIDLSNGSKEIKLNTIFAGSVVKINKDTPIKIKAETAFGNVELPNGNTVAFGTGRYENEAYSKDTNHVYLKVDVVFGDFKLRTY